MSGFAVSVGHMLLIEDALSLMLNNVPLLGTENVALADAIGYVLRENVLSDLDLPPFDRARMDGYALQSSDTEHATADAPANS